MAVFQLTPTEDAERLERVVTASFDEKDRYILPGKQACFVKFDGTTAELSSHLDLTGERSKENRPCPAVIIEVNIYGGYAPTALWEWLKSRMGD